MRQWVWKGLWLLSTLLIGGCAAVAPREGDSAGDAGLERWLVGDVIPYLKQRLGNHPRFQGQSVFIVKMDGQNVSPSIDQLTAWVRDMVFNELLQAPGVTLAWRPEIRPWRHHDSLKELHCGEYRDIDHYLGVDIQSYAGGKVIVSLKALDLREERWVAGFGRVWRGQLSAAQREALRQVAPDEYLRGLRPLPFEQGQIDLAAAYLARNLSCLFKESPYDSIGLHVVPLSRRNAPEFLTLQALIGKYLGQFQEVEILDDPGRANVELETTVDLVDRQRGIYQFWLMPKFKKDGRWLGGATTMTYVHLSRSVPQTAALSRSTPRKSERQRQRLIADFGLVRPENDPSCRFYLPWFKGHVRLSDGVLLLRGSCVGLQIQLQRKGYVVVLGHYEGQGWFRVPGPNVPLQLMAAQPVRLPPDDLPQDDHICLDGPPGLVRFVVFATGDPVVAHRLGDVVQALPATVMTDGTTGQEVFDELMRQVDVAPVDWRTLTVKLVGSWLESPCHGKGA